MQTFLPYADFAASAASLDRARLGKQRVETLQVLRALVIPDYGWRSHPAVRMWMGYVPALTRYGLVMADEWIARGGADSTRGNILEFAPEADAPDADGSLAMPSWLGNEDLHRSHRSNLIRKAPELYAEAFPEDDGELPYLWPDPEQVLLPQEPGDDRVWILRMPAAEALLTELDTAGDLAGSGFTVSLPRTLPNGRTSGKHRRQVNRFLSELRVGELLAIPQDGGRRFAVSRVLDEAHDDGESALERQVELIEVLARSAFPNSARLQDPRVFFAVPSP
ncbi:MAG: hypothetical protein JWO93_1643 [Micrococcaceae bacterium]|nr:hypothetical protein [Micrococcaceae bacterium]